jgi:hypothetical protein
MLPGPDSGSLGLANPLARDQATLAQRKANAPMRPGKPQTRDAGPLFGDGAGQSDLIDLHRKLSAQSGGRVSESTRKAIEKLIEVRKAEGR